MASFSWPQSGGRVATYATFADFPSASSSGAGALAIALDTDTLYLSDGITWSAVGGAGVALLVGALDGQPANAQGLSLTANTLYQQSADAIHPGLVNNAVQSFSGNKTFTGTIAASNFSGSSSGTNTGDVTLSAVGSSPNANAASLTGQVLNLQPADGSNPGVISTSAQTLAGVKTFSSAPNFSSLTASQALVLDGSKNVASLAYQATPSVSTIASRDTNGNIATNNFVSLSTSVASASGNTILTAASTRYQTLNGTQVQTFTLPDATTLRIGWRFEFNNNSTGTLTVNNNGGSQVASLVAGASGAVICISTSTSNGAWDVHFDLPSNSVYGTAGLTVTGTIVATSTISASNFSGSSSGSNTGDVTLSAFGSAPNSNGASLSGQALTLQPADNTNPGGVSTTTQTFAGIKTFSSAPNFSSLTASTALVLDGSKNVTSLAYDSANTPSTLVERDGSGNFSAGTITASLTGTASGNTTYSANNHGVVLSSATNAMAVLAPNASTAFPLISGGTGADPSWAALSVAGGGTGQTSSLTQYGIVYADTTSSMASTAAGTSGYLLTSNNSSAPTYQQLNLASSAAITGVLPAANVGLTRTLNSQSGTTYTLALADGSGAGGDPLILFTSGSAVTVTIPTHASIAFPTGTQIDVIQQGAGKVTFSAAGGVTLNSQSSNKSIAAQYVAVSLVQTAQDVWTLMGNLIA